MKHTLVATLAVTMLAGLLLAGGCQPRNTALDRCRLQVRNLSTELNKSRADLEAARIENEQATQDAAQARQRADAALQSHALLQKQFDNLDATYKKLRDAYADITSATPKVPALGGVNVLPTDVNDALAAFARENADLLEFNPKYGMVKFKSDLTFKPGSDYVKPEAKQALETFVQIVNAQSAAQFNVYIAGHTDDMRIVRKETLKRHPNNWYLSVHRAVAVQEILEKAGLDPTRIGAMGFGEYHPIAPNKANKGGNEINRRVEIWIVPKGRYLTQ